MAEGFPHTIQEKVSFTTRINNRTQVTTIFMHLLKYYIYKHFERPNYINKYFMIKLYCKCCTAIINEYSQFPVERKATLHSDPTGEIRETL